MNHLDERTIHAIADGEAANEHVRECAQCAAAALEVMQLKRAIRALPRFDVGRVLNPSPVRKDGLRTRPTWIWAAAAAIVLALLLVPYVAGRATARDLVDLHTTIVASAAPVEVLSTDRHTVKPWFEGKVPFAVAVPELAGTPFRLIGGRVVFFRGKPCAYLLVQKGAHRVSVFVFDAAFAPRIGAMESMSIETWRARGLAYVAVSDLPRADLEVLRQRF
jgi:anti-sigma factor RsiW